VSSARGAGSPRTDSLSRRPDDPRIAAECKRLLAVVRKRCPNLLPPDPVAAGTVVGAVHLSAEETAPLFASAGAVATAVEEIESEAPVLWREGERELLVRQADVSARFALGVVAVSIPVFCDQVGEAVVHVTFVIGDPSRPAGLLAGTEDRPRGPAAVVDAWGDSLVAFAWQVLIEVVANVAGEAGRDVDGSPLMPIGIGASAEGLFVVPMARHAFDAARG
jgi:hypothetical protein